MSNKLPTYFLSHGGGPWPWLPQRETAYGELEKSLLGVRDDLGENLQAILMISGHWEESTGFGIMSSPNPPMLYDYYNFPEHTYSIKYESPGAPELAMEISETLSGKGHSTWLDPERGYDHGVFTIAYCMYPAANVPILQISIRSDYDPATHIQLGRDLAYLRERGVAIIGSGLSYHNLAHIRMPELAARESAGFDRWLTEALENQDAESRTKAILAWEKAPNARDAHPEEDHLIPLMVALGAAETEPATRIYHQNDFLGGTTASSFRFG